MEDNTITLTLNASRDERSWYFTMREDKSVCLYWTRDYTQCVVYDSLNEDKLNAMRSENDNLSQQVANLSVELGIALRQRDALSAALLNIKDYATARAYPLGTGVDLATPT
jgi:hypothetical protein